MFPVLRSSLTPAPFLSNPINRLDSLFDRVFGDDSRFLSQVLPTLPLAMWEDDDHIYVEAEAPGVSENDVEVTFHNGMLFIRGERKPLMGRTYLYNGQSFGRFERVVRLPDTVSTDEVEATLTNGLLCIALPKSPDAKPKKITLKTGATH